MTSINSTAQYQIPPKVMADLVNAPLTPVSSIDPSNTWMLLLERPSMPSIQEVAQEELRLAGLRINPKTNGRSRSVHYTGMTLKSIENGQEYSVNGLPPQARIENISWSNDGSKIAFTITKKNGLELWMVSVKTAQAEQLTKAIINDAIAGLPYRWLPDNHTIIYKSIIPNRGNVPQKMDIPIGPTIQENRGEKAIVRTYQDLLKNKFDETLFEYYTTAQLLKLNTTTKESQPIGQPSIIQGFSHSPDGNYLLVIIAKRPFSYIVPYYRFAMEASVLDMHGNLIKQVANIPAAENIPKGFGSVRLGPRAIMWRLDVPATLYWVEAQDGGDIQQTAEIRDQLFFLKAPFTGTPQPSLTFQLRFASILWGNGGLAITTESWWKHRQVIVKKFAPDYSQTEATILYNRSYEDRYSDPGNFVLTTNQYGRGVLMTDSNGTKLYLVGLGASPKGNRPFWDELDTSTQKTTRLWRSKAPYYERVMRILNPSKRHFITIRESNDLPPNFYIRDLEKDSLKQFSTFPNPYEALKGVKKELIRYQRNDGIELTGTLYLPKNYAPEKDGRLPVLMWAYPREYKSAKAASQIKDSPYQFIRFGFTSPILWVTQGYAVFNNFGMPIIGEGDEEPNETFIEQLVAGAAAAINKLVDMGIADKHRIGVGGHSYGAFMTANLMAHSDLFAAGIARSGAYNRTLTPFGFQSEERTFWESPDTYFKMSPFMAADKIKAPLLLIHGEADNNSGTYPMQSERFYAALKGHGAVARLVMLPHESHGYRAKESVLHVLWEMHTWLETHVKQRS